MKRKLILTICLGLFCCAGWAQEINTGQKSLVGKTGEKVDTSKVVSGQERSGRIDREILPHGKVMRTEEYLNELEKKEATTKTQSK
ncbi:hypothetical protein [Parvicella tangerina]|uniref:Uncharacterized protein n=1 Tax=Parvicella tangerina TaxID=2829795 RepID=A0A916JRM1_9FLAO|nr:hypothetical protein [Parvicella tangerina]CAG5086177.1 hypothetical protein CRYO30217_03034 [Parvicella tangerina]